MQKNAVVFQGSVLPNGKISSLGPTRDALLQGAEAVKQGMRARTYTLRLCLCQELFDLRREALPSSSPVRQTDRRDKLTGQPRRFPVSIWSKKHRQVRWHFSNASSFCSVCYPAGPTPHHIFAPKVRINFELIQKEMPETRCLA